MSLPEILLAIVVVAAGTAVQASIGFGLAMISAPLLLLIDNALVPGPLIAHALLLSLWVAWHERHAIDFSHMRFAVIGMVVGTVPAVWLLSRISSTTFDLLFGTLVLLAVGMSVMHGTLHPTQPRVFIATLASGFMGTVSSIGGPPLALVYQNANAAQLRANLAGLFVIGTTVSLLALAIAGEFGVRDLGYTAYLFDGLLVGVLCSVPLKKYLDGGSARPWLLGLCFLSACSVLVRAAWRLVQA